MGFDLEISVPALTVFIQGILSFFSPCVLPLVPLYVGYLAGGAKTVEADGTIRYPRGRVMWNTLFFVLGISVCPYRPRRAQKYPAESASRFSIDRHRSRLRTGRPGR